MRRSMPSGVLVDVLLAAQKCPSHRSLPHPPVTAQVLTAYLSLSLGM